MKQFTYKQIGELFVSLGFQMRVLDGNTIVYYRPDSEAYFTLPLREEGELVSPMHMGGARAILDAWGYLDKDEFTARLKAG